MNNLFREYLRFINTAPTWMIHAARNQNLSVPTDSSVLAHTPNEESLPHSGQRGGHSIFWQWIDKTQ